MQLAKHCDSMAELLAFSKAAIPVSNPNHKYAGEHQHREDNRSVRDMERWYGVQSLADCDAILSKGWPEGVKRMEEALGKIQCDVKPVSIRRRKHWTEQGDELDMQRVYNGQLDTAWQSTRRESKQGGCPIIRIVSDLSINCSQKPDDLFWTGAAALRLSDLLSEAGYSVEIIGQWAVTELYDENGKDRNGYFSVTLKAPDTLLDKSNLAASLCYVGFLRRAIVNAAFRLSKKVTYFLGYPYHSLVEDLHAGQTVFVPNINSQHDAEQWLKEVLQAFSE